MLLFVGVLIGVSAMAVLVDAEPTAAEPSDHSGNCGANVTYEFDPDLDTSIIRA